MGASSSTLLEAVIVLTPCLLMVLCSSMVTCWNKHRRQLLALQEPLLADQVVDHRVNAATREVEAGFTVCPGCEFENFKRYAYCSLCGEKLAVVPPAAAAASDEECADKLETSTDSTIPSEPRARTARQLRVRKRKEWVRKMDVDGNLFWYRSCIESGSASVTAPESQQPGYVVVLQRSEVGFAESLALDKRRTRDFNLEDLGGTTTAAAPAIPDLEEAQQLPVLISEATKIEVIDASKADPAARLNLDSAANAIEKYAKLSEIIALATRDFPTKYVHFVVSTAALLVPAETKFVKLAVHREFMLEESVDFVGCVAEEDVHSYMRINFVEESGVDAGGVYREWFMLVNELLLAPDLHLFKRTNKSEQSYHLNPNSAHCIGEEHLAYYFAAGRLIGRALLEGNVWGFHLSLPLIKIILGIPVTFSDLEYLDPEVYRSLVWLRENDGVEDLGLDFTVTEKRGDEICTIDLIPNGHNIDVTDANKHEYLERKFHYMVFESVSSQLYAFLKGLHEVIPQELLMIFDAQEFDYLLCGTQEIDVEDWKAHTVSLATNLKWNDVLTWFWEVVAEMPNEYRRRLLLFATGSSRVPLGGFAGLTSYDGRLCPFTLKAVSYYSTQYISSHACFNRLDVPLYRSKEELRTVLLAILDTDLYGFTTA